MSRNVCIHGHFYQPPRENPWLEAIELQDSAYPHHDWNVRITSECYAPNSAARIFEGKRLMQIVDNYSIISFNFGPTLLSWMEANRPDVYKAILEADKIGMGRFSGHGPAIAQAYNHMIMPLANSRDKRTQVIWGLKDFEHRFGRKPEGMWLPETAVDYESLEIMAGLGLRFTILAPRQASRIRKIGEKEWTNVSEGKIDPKMPYLCRLPSGKTITIFIYDGPISQDLGFGRLLESGEGFAHRLVSAFAEENGQEDQLVHIATDGETYGHHHAFGDMALAYCLHFIEKNNLAKLTIYGEYLDKAKPTHEAQIHENSSWSCIHGIERWRSDCGCNTGGHCDWNQKWRGPLRGALDWLRDNLIQIYENQSKGLLKNSWRARDEYINVILDRSEKKVEAFLKKHSEKDLSAEEKIKTLRLLEMQRNAMLMYTSCAWFFDEISGIETTQVMGYAARAMQLAHDVSDISLEEAFVSLLGHAPTNIPEHINGAEVYTKFVKPTVLDLLRVGIHYGVSSLFHDYPEITQIYTYRIVNHAYDRAIVGIQKLAIGRISVRSKITWAEGDISYAVLHLGDHNIVGGARYYQGEEPYKEMEQALQGSFTRGDLAESIRLIDSYFSGHNISLWHLFRDEQQMVLYKIFDHTMRDIENSIRQISGHLSPVMSALQGGKMRIPKYFSMVLEFLLETDIRKALESPEVNFAELEGYAEQARRWPLNIDKTALGYIASRKIEQYMEEWNKAPQDLEQLEKAARLTGICTSLGLHLDLWKTQTIYFFKGRQMLGEMRRKAAENNERAKRWLEIYFRLGDYQNIRVE